jgi:hypothetical protein
VVCPLDNVSNDSENNVNIDTLEDHDSILSCHLYQFRSDNKVPYIFTISTQWSPLNSSAYNSAKGGNHCEEFEEFDIFTDLRHLITWYACLPGYFTRKDIKTVVKVILRQNNGKNIKMIFCAQITLKWHFLKSQHEFLYKFYIFWFWSLNISIYVERNFDANRITE